VFFKEPENVHRLGGVAPPPRAVPA
jgi:hypothetical protein